MFERFVAILRSIHPDGNAMGPVDMDTRLADDLGLGSLALLRIVVACDREFGVDIAGAEENLAALLVVSDALGLIESLGGV